MRHWRLQVHLLDDICVLLIPGSLRDVRGFLGLQSERVTWSDWVPVRTELLCRHIHHNQDSEGGLPQSSMQRDCSPNVRVASLPDYLLLCLCGSHSFHLCVLVPTIEESHQEKKHQEVRRLILLFNLFRRVNVNGRWGFLSSHTFTPQ